MTAESPWLQKTRANQLRLWEVKYCTVLTEECSVSYPHSNLWGDERLFSVAYRYAEQTCLPLRSLIGLVWLDMEDRLSLDFRGWNSRLFSLVSIFFHMSTYEIYNYNLTPQENFLQYYPSGNSVLFLFPSVCPIWMLSSQPGEDSPLGKTMKPVFGGRVGTQGLTKHICPPVLPPTEITHCGAPSPRLVYF